MKWDSRNIKDQSGKRILITGGNSGIGLEAARVLAAKGAEIILAIRNLRKGQQAKQEILRATPDASVTLIEIDLSDLTSVNYCVQDLLHEDKAIDVLINNAGVMQFDQRKTSAQGYELMWATNHLGHFAFTAGVLPLLEKAKHPRVVTLSSMVAKFKAADIYYSDLNFEKGYDKMSAYAQSKLANVMVAVELQERLEKSGSKVLSVAAHPGYTATNLQQHMGLSGIIMNALFAQKVAVGALPTLMAATDDNLLGGEYIGPMKMQNWRGYPGRNVLPKPAEDSQQRQKLWQITEQILGLSFLSKA